MIVQMSDVIKTLLQLVVDSIHAKMAPGEAKYDILSSGYQLSVSYPLMGDLIGGILAPPPFSSSVASSAITLPASGLRSCPTLASASPTDAVKFSIAQINSPLHANRNESISPTLRYSVQSVSASQSTLGSHDKSVVDTYSLILQFSVPNNFTETDAVLNLPFCSIFKSGSSILCNCNITSVTAYNVTLSCLDLNDLCPTYSVSSAIGERDIQESSSPRFSYDHPHFALRGRASINRRLDFDYSNGGLDDNEDESSDVVVEYDTIVISLKKEIEHTLSDLPGLPTVQSTSIIVFVVLFVFLVFAGIIGTHLWDRSDAVYLRYVQRLGLGTKLPLSKRFSAAMGTYKKHRDTSTINVPLGSPNKDNCKYLEGFVDGVEISHSNLKLHNIMHQQAPLGFGDESVASISIYGGEGSVQNLDWNHFTDHMACSSGDVESEQELSPRNIVQHAVSTDSNGMHTLHRRVNLGDSVDNESQRGMFTKASVDTLSVDHEVILRHSCPQKIFFLLTIYHMILLRRTDRLV